MVSISALQRITDVIRRHLFLYLISFITASIIVSSYLILRFEAGYADSQIKTVHDALWWSAVGISTIGIGNILPQSDAGRYLTLFLMIIGIIVFSVITAKIASIFTEEEVKKDFDREIKTIEGDLGRVEHDIEGEIAVDDRQIESKLTGVEKRLAKLEKKKK